MVRVIRVHLKELASMFQNGKVFVAPVSFHPENFFKEVGRFPNIFCQQVDAKTFQSFSEFRRGRLLGNLGIQLSNLRERVPPFSLRRRQ